jgi:hypothetical protein
MSGSPIGPGEIDVLYALSFGIRLLPSRDGRWVFDNGILAPTEIINSLINKGLACVRDGKLKITDEGRERLFEELDLSLKRVPEWLKSTSTRRRKANARR